MNPTRPLSPVYADLEIRLLPFESEGYPVEITFGGGQQFPRGYLKPDLLPWVSGASPAADGERLFDRLLADDRLKMAWAEARGQNPGRRIRLRIDDAAPELHAIPWELLRDASPDRVPQTLGADAATPFSRYLAGPWRPRPPVKERPIRLLAAIAAPDDLAAYGLAPVNLPVERQAIQAACHGLARRQLAITFLESPVTLATLEAELRKGYHVLHIVAHGAAPGSGKPAILILADSANKVTLVPEDELAEMLARLPESLQLVYLDACQSATRSPADAFRGFAPKLVAAGIPAVMAMQDLVPVQTGQKLTGAFYRRLLQHGQVDLASNEARSALLSGGEARIWGIPALYSRVSNGQIFLPARPRPILLPLLAVFLMLVAALAAFGWTQGWFIQKMPRGAFNLAVARFSTEGAPARCAQGGRAVSQWLFDAIQRETARLPASFGISPPRGPGEVKTISGVEPSTRTAQAARVAAKHNATILIYGTIGGDDSGCMVQPEFYVADEAFGYGSEATGSERLGKPVAFALPLDPVGVNKKLFARQRALRYLVTGLAHFYDGQYDQAWADFGTAATEPGWADDEGKEVAYLLLGAARLSAYGPGATTDQAAEALGAAQAAFAEAYRINPGYARSHLGLGGVALAQAQLSRPADEAKLLEAKTWYEASAKAPDQPASAYIAVKSDFGLGQVYLVGLHARPEAWPADEARRKLESVVRAYETQPSADLAWYAGQAHCGLGRLVGEAGDYAAMVAECRRAIDLLKTTHDPPDDWIALYWSWIAAAEKNQGHTQACQAAYRQAITTAERFTRPDRNAFSAADLTRWKADLDCRP
jgi:tetratricopeptide (TPR) repeat protein